MATGEATATEFHAIPPPFRSDRSLSSRLSRQTQVIDTSIQSLSPGRSVGRYPDAKNGELRAI